MLSEECPSNEGPDDAATHHPQTNQFKSKSHRESPDCANVTILCLNLAASGRCTTSKRRRTARNKTDFRRITDAPAARATVRGIGAGPRVPSFFDNEPEGQYFRSVLSDGCGLWPSYLACLSGSRASGRTRK